MAGIQEQTSQRGSGATRTLKMGIIGIGVGATEILPSMEDMEEIEVVAGADVNAETLQRFGKQFPGAKLYDSVEKLLADPNVEAVWISSPNRFHAPHTITAANAGKHVVVEKPMALNLEQAEQMVEAVERNGVKLMAGHTRSYTMPVRAMRAVVQSGRLGKLCAIHLWAYSDWMLRPRTPDELDVSQGGGVPYRQVPHQIDTVRVLGGGMLRSVRGMTGQWESARPIPGYYTAYLEFEDGTPATVVHNGYGYFVGAELVPWGESTHWYTMEERVKVRKALRSGTRREDSEKQDMRIGGAGLHYGRPQRKPWVPEDMGLLVVSCERGDLRHSQYGIYVYDDDGQHDIELMPANPVARRGELVELYEAIVNGKPVYHDGRWGMATLEVGLAIMQSARERREIMLTHQVPVAPDYDADLTVDFSSSLAPNLSEKSAE
jgi:phthalate 4,5-cis-dihydrodiol dehydrogenase